MKKISILVAALAVVLGTSCKKPRTCTCTAGGGYSTSSTVVMTKKDAQDYCDSEQAYYGSGVTCSLD
jgi:hypothetical protein